MGNQPGVEAKAHNRKKRRGSKKAHEVSKKELRMSVEQLQNLVPYLENNIKQLKEVAHRSAQRDYTMLPGAGGQIHPFTASQKEENRSKNRYANIVAYDHSRVTVTPNALNLNSDYFNGNRLPGHPGKHEYIACQGPVPDSFYSHWQAVWENNISVIVMVTNEVEGGRLKCHRYWPEPGTEVDYGEFQLSCISEKPKPTYITRKFELTSKGETRNVTQFTYTVWPDHGVPNTTQEILTFRKAVMAHNVNDATVMVHCSAGVGRSGTYIAIDRLLLAADDLRPLDVKSVVSDLRDQRNYMVQTPLQYLFVYQAIIDALSKRLRRAERALRGATGGTLNEDEYQGDLDAIEEELEAAREDLARQVGYNEDQATEIIDHLDVRFADARAADGSANDVGAAKAISRAQRIESLMHAANDQDSWRANAAQPEDRGYAGASRAALDDRLNALKEQSSPEKWKLGYKTAAEQWATVQGDDGDAYDLTTSLTPLESRLQSLAFQREQSILRGKQFRTTVEHETMDMISSLTARLTSLQDTVETADQRWRKKGSGLRGAAAEAPHRAHTAKKLGTLSDRLNALKSHGDGWKKRGDGFRGEVDHPSLADNSKLVAAMGLDPGAAQAEAEPEPEPEPEAKPAPPKEKEAPIKSSNGVLAQEDPETKAIDDRLTSHRQNLRQSPEKKPTTAHPMVAQASAAKPSGPQGGKLRKKRNSHPMLKPK